MRKKAFYLFLTLFVGFLLYLQFSRYSQPEFSTLKSRVKFLKDKIHEPLQKGYGIYEVSDFNHEWIVFCYAFTTYAYTNIAIQNPEFKAETSEAIEVCIEKMLTDTTFYYYFGTPVEPPLPLDDEISAFYFGHLNLMLGAYRKLNPKNEHVQLHDSISSILAEEICKNPCNMVASYPNQTWVSDNSVVYASLALHSKLTGSSYMEIADAWIETLREKHLTEDGLFYTQIDVNDNCKDIEEPRGSNIPYFVLFAKDFAPVFCEELFESYVEHHSDYYLLGRVFLERKGNHETNWSGDIDSGPVVYGYSLPATGMGFGAAVALEEYQLANDMYRLFKLGTATKTDSLGGTYYSLRFREDINYSPLTEAIMLYMETQCTWY